MARHKWTWWFICAFAGIYFFFTGLVFFRFLCLFSVGVLSMLYFPIQRKPNQPEGDKVIKGTPGANKVTK